MNEKFHLLGSEAMAVELPQQFTCPYCYEPHPLALMAVERVQRYVATREDWADELGAGKMLGGRVIGHSSAMVLYPSGLRGRSAKPLFTGSNPVGT